MRAIRFFQKLSASPHFLPLVIVIFFAWLSARPLFGTGYFNMHDDLQMMRQLNMEKCFLDFQIPCRWIPDMGYGFGYPLFNFYPPLPYLTGMLFRVVGYSFMDTAKALFILSLFASGISMYFLGRKFFGRLGGVLASVFYVWAPYHAVDVYVRGAMNESWALIWFPLIFLLSYEILAKDIKKWKLSQNISLIIGLALSWAGLLTSHNLMVIVFTPFFAVWCGVWLLYFRNWKTILPLVLSGVWAFALAAFFTLPVFLEKSIVQTDTLVRGYYEYTAHFPSAAQLFFSRFWGYGPSVWMTADDKMSFQIGWFHWAVPLIVIVVTGILFLRKRTLSKTTIVIATVFALGLVATFMTHPRSTPIWAQIKALQFIQFPWRYLTVVIFSFSFVVGAAVTLLRGAKRNLVTAILILAAVIYSWSYFQPEHGKLGPLTDEQKFTGAAWELQQTAGIYDYLPNTAKTAPKAPRDRQADIISGKGEVFEGESGTNWERLRVKVEEPLSLRINVMEFPEWKVYIDGQEVPHYISEKEEWGRIYVDVPAGEHDIYVKLFDTPVRTAGNVITAIAWLILIAILVVKRKELRSLPSK